MDFLLPWILLQNKGKQRQKKSTKIHQEIHHVFHQVHSRAQTSFSPCLPGGVGGWSPLWPGLLPGVFLGCPSGVFLEMPVGARWVCSWGCLGLWVSDGGASSRRPGRQVATRICFDFLRTAFCIQSWAKSLREIRPCNRFDDCIESRLTLDDLVHNVMNWQGQIGHAILTFVKCLFFFDTTCHLASSRCMLFCILRGYSF